MIRKLTLAALVLALAATAAAQARHRAVPLDANGNLDALVSQYAAANNIPESLVRRVIARESGGNPRAVSRGNYGLMQIKLATARGLGYRGDAAGLLDANTNMQYAVKYLANAYRVAGGNPDRAVHYYAAGYYYAAKRQGLTGLTVDANANAASMQAYATVPTITAAGMATSRTNRVEPIN